MRLSKIKWIKLAAFDLHSVGSSMCQVDGADKEERSTDHRAACKHAKAGPYGGCHSDSLIN